MLGSLRNCNNCRQFIVQQNSSPRAIEGKENVVKGN
jgi:hypothetical protein